MRKRISDKNVFPSFSLETEYKKIHELIFDKDAFGKVISYTMNSRPCYSYNDCLQMMFLDWKLRGSFTSIEEMLYGLEISEDHFEKDITGDRLLDYLQFVLNAICFIENQIDQQTYAIYRNGKTLFNAIVNNCKYVIARLGAEIKQEKDEFFIVYKDDVATIVVAQNEELESSIVEYLKVDNRGDIERKAEILCTLAKRLEPYEGKLKNMEFGALCSDTTYLLNKVARHNQNPEKKTDAVFAEMDSDEFELWQDRVFNMFLACMAVLPYTEIKTEINELKKGKNAEYN